MSAGPADLRYKVLGQGPRTSKYRKQSGRRSELRQQPRATLLERAIHLIGNRSLASPIPRLYAAFLNQSHLKLVIEYTPFGSLWDRLSDTSHVASDTRVLSETEIEWWISQAVVALTWLHGQGYIHRSANMTLGTGRRSCHQGRQAAQPAHISRRSAQAVRLWIRSSFGAS